jgi:hypothetical protein
MCIILNISNSSYNDDFLTKLPKNAYLPNN